MSKPLPLVSIIVPTKDNERTIEKCIMTCVNQTYPNVEVLVIDNHSTDRTREIASSLGARVIVFGPERNLQRPEGARLAKGEWLMFPDSDMYISPTLVEDCMNQYEKDPSLEGFILPEISIGKHFWTRCKIYERKFYTYYNPLLTARLIRRDAYDKVGGWDKTLISGEDFDIHEKLEVAGARIGRSHEFMEHDEGEIHLPSYLKKKYYYGRFLKKFLAKSHRRHTESASRDIFFMRTCFYRYPKWTLQHPILYVSMFVLMFLTQFSYVLGMLFGKHKT
ncbi:MAG TPA: glycosyltransferase family 2 protein [Candidatus Gracilibacteria bacterium]